MLKLLITSLALGNLVQASPSWTVYHSWNEDQEFTKRGELTWSDEEGALQISNVESLTNENVQAMLDYGWYHVKIESPGDDNFVLSTVPACNLRRANFKDEFQVTLPRTQESQITSLAYLPLVSPLAPKSCEEYGELTEEQLKFTSKVSLSLDTPGAILKAVLPQSKPPPGLTFISHPRFKKNAGKTAAGAAGSKTADGGLPPGAETEEPPQSFMRRYWYIILPLMIANLLGGQPMEQEGQQQQGGNGASGGQGGAPAAPVAATSAGGGGQKQRRGKRT